MCIVPRWIWCRLVSLNGIRSTRRRSVCRSHCINLRAQRRAGGPGILVSRHDQHWCVSPSALRRSPQPLVEGVRSDLLSFFFNRIHVLSFLLVFSWKLLYTFILDSKWTQFLCECAELVKYGQQGATGVELLCSILIRALDVGQCEVYATSLSRSRHGALPQDRSFNALYNLHDQSRYPYAVISYFKLTER